MTPASERRRLRIVVADDSRDVIEEIVALLEVEYTVLDSVADGGALVAAASRLRPDVVISDVNMPGMNGVEAGRRIVQAGACSAVILLTVYNDVHLVAAALEAGIRGYVLKSDAGEELIGAVERVSAGGTYFSCGVQRFRT